MDYFISIDDEVSLDNYSKVSSFVDLSVADKTSIVVIHSFTETTYTAALSIIDLIQNRGIYKVVYINSKPVNDIKVLVESLGGLHSNDDYLLSSIEELEDLVDTIEEGNSVSLTELNSSFKRGISVVSDFITRFENDDDSIFDPIYLEVVNRALRDVDELFGVQESNSESLGIALINGYSDSFNSRKELKSEVEKLKSKLEEVEEYSNITHPKRGDTLSYFPPITYAGNTPFVVFKELSACRYLTSFVLAYANHLTYVKSKRVRVLIVVNKQPGVVNKYKNYFELTQSNYNSSNALVSTVSYTTTPLKSIINSLTSNSDEIIIVIDRTYQKDPIVKGRVSVYYGVSGYSEFENENIPLDKSIFTLTGVEGCLVTLGHINSYPDNIDSRFVKYENLYKDVYKDLDYKLGMM